VRARRNRWGGSLLGGTSGSIGIGLSDVSVFALKTRVERILFVIDTNCQRVTDRKGGLKSYQVIKDEITDMVGNLSAGTLFNMMLHDRNKTMLFKLRFAFAGGDAHQQLIQWMTPINSDANQPGLEGVRGASSPALPTLADDPVNDALPIITVATTLDLLLRQPWSSGLMRCSLLPSIIKASRLCVAR
jgi:hypothetical protein